MTREDVLRNPTLVGAMQFWDRTVLGDPISPDAPLAGIHKARLHWLKSTPQMIAESRAWLRERGFTLETKP